MLNAGDDRDCDRLARRILAGCMLQYPRPLPEGAEMPLVSCPDCNTQVSDKAPACPKCGHPFAAQTVQATGKKWKALQLVGGLVLGVGLLTTCAFLMVGSAGAGQPTGPA